MIIDTKQAAEKFGYTTETMLAIFKKKGSPAFRIKPESARSRWRVDEEKLESFLIKSSERCKG